MVLRKFHSSPVTECHWQWTPFLVRGKVSSMVYLFLRRFSPFTFTLLLWPLLGHAASRPSRWIRVRCVINHIGSYHLSFVLYRPMTFCADFVFLSHPIPPACFPLFLTVLFAIYHAAVHESWIPMTSVYMFLYYLHLHLVSLAVSVFRISILSVSRYLVFLLPRLTLTVLSP